jgi:hypothetical protein
MTERLIYTDSTHWIKYVLRTLKYLLFSIMGVILLAISTMLVRISLPVFATPSLIGVFMLLFFHHKYFHYLLSEAMNDIIVTDERVIYFNDCLFLCDDEHEIPLEKVAAVEVQQHGFLQNVLNYGVLWFDTGGGTIDLKRSIPNVPHPDHIADIITPLLKEKSWAESSHVPEALPEQ